MTKFREDPKKVIKYAPAEARVKLFLEVPIEDRMNTYSKFLQEGDFEEWQQYCYIDKDSPEFKIAKVRALWIMSRFEVYCSIEWKKLLVEKNELIKSLNN